VALLATQHSSHGRPARRVGHDQGSLIGVAHVGVSPVQECDQGGLQLDTRSRQSVLVAGASPRDAIGLEPKHTLGHQMPESDGENVAGDAETLLEDLETGRPLERLPQDQPRPPIRQNGDRGSHGAVRGVVVRPRGRRGLRVGHGPRVPELSIQTQANSLSLLSKLRR